MKTLIVWAGKYGFTQKCAELLKDKLTGETDILNAKEAQDIPDGYDAVILGSSVYAGSLRKELVEFTALNKERLMGLKLGFFLSAFDEDYEKYLEKNLDDELYAHISVKGRFGYAFDFKKMGFLERNIIKMISKKKESTEAVDDEAVSVFTENIKK